jgi:hypothetical protein
MFKNFRPNVRKTNSKNLASTSYQCLQRMWTSLLRSQSCTTHLVHCNAKVHTAFGCSLMIARGFSLLTTTLYKVKHHVRSDPLITFRNQAPISASASVTCFVEFSWLLKISLIFPSLSMTYVCRPEQMTERATFEDKLLDGFGGIQE